MTRVTDEPLLPPAGGPRRDWGRLVEATRVTALIHADQVRKDTTIPYLSHLLGACSIALDYGANEDEAIAALLHDAIEDGEPMDAANQAVSRFSDEVRRIVDGCTDAVTRPTAPWFERKQMYLARLATEDRAILLVSASDKLHNARSIVRDLRVHGDALWSRFSAPRECTLWYYRSLVTVYRANPNHTADLIDELDRTVADIESLAGLDGNHARRAEIASGAACREWATAQTVP